MKNYPKYYQDLNRMMEKLGAVIPQPMSAFSQLHKSSVNDGALSCKTKELIALAIAITVRCDGCIAYHVHDVLNAGASKAEIMETIGVAIMMGGGPSVVYGCEAMEAVEQFEAEKES